MGLAVLCRIAALTLSVSIPVAGQNHIITPHDIVTLKKVAEPQISPDGSLIVYSVTTPQPAGEPKMESIWMAASGQPNSARSLTWSDGADSSPRWSPDGKYVAFLSTRKNPIRLKGESPFPFKLNRIESRPDLVEALKDEPKKDAHQGAQLWLLSLSGGEAVPLTNLPGEIKSFKWSADGTRIAFIRADVDTKTESERKEKKIDDRRVDFDYRFDRLYIYTLAAHEASLVTTGERNVCDFDWSPDGRRFLARISPTPRLDDFWRVSKIQILDASTGEVQQTLAEHAMSLPIHWSPDGDHLTYSKMTEKAITGYPVVYDTVARREIPLGENLPVTWQHAEWSGDGGHLVLTGVERTTAVIADVDWKSGRATIRQEHDSTLRDFSLSRDGSMIVAATGTIASPPEIYLLQEKAWIKLTDTNPQVHDWKLGEVKEVHWKSSHDGRTIYGVLVYPTGYIPGTRYKALVQFHGGPEGVWETGWLGSWHDWAQLMASHGYAVLLPNPRGSDGQGPQFVEANYRDWGGADFQDEMDGADFLVEQGIADKEKMVAGGWSYGGFMASWTITHTNRFKAAVVGAGVTDLVSMAAITDISPSFLDGYFGDLASHRELYRKHSPVSYLDTCVTPTLVVHGEADDRVPISQGQELYYGLRFMGRETRMIRFPREPHVFAERDHQEALLAQVLSWFDDHLH